MSKEKQYGLVDLCKYFLYLGSTGFGGPVALVGYMHKDLIEERKWFSEAEYKEGLALAQLAPGPLATQLCIYLGFVHYGILGATLAGFAFVIPSFFMVLGIGYAYVAFNGLPWMQSLFYGVGAGVVGIIAVSSYKLTIKSVSDFKLPVMREKWMLWIFYLVCVAYTAWTETEEIGLFLFLAVSYMFYQNQQSSSRIRNAWFLLLLPLTVPAFTADWDLLGQIALFFGKAGAFVFGSGLAIVPFLHGGVVAEHHWLNEQQFLDAVAVAMITPGPVVITVGFIGYLVAGVPGAIVAALATFLPCYLFTILPAPYFKQIASNKWVKHFVDGITACVIGALVGSVIVIASRSVVDVPTACIATGAALALWYVKKIQEPAIILASASLGVLLKLSGIV